MMKINRLSAIALILLTGLVLAAPLAAFPPQCETNCRCTSKCTQICADGNVVMNCGSFGLCVGECLATADKTPTSDSLRDAIFAEASPVANQPVPAAPAR